jgi:hypothetical protein
LSAFDPSATLRRAIAALPSCSAVTNQHTLSVAAVFSTKMDFNAWFNGYASGGSRDIKTQTGGDDGDRMAFVGRLFRELQL